MCRALTVTTIAVATLAGGVLAGSGRHDQLALFAPAASFDAADRKRLAAGTPIVDVLPSRGRDLAVVAAVRTRAGGDQLVTWTRQIDRLQRGTYVPQIVRFSATPGIEDLSDLVLEDGDLEDLRRCRPGDCGLKLAAHEITEVRQTMAAAGPDWESAVQQAFRHIVLGRAQRYLTEGHAGTPAYHDRSEPISPETEFATILGWIDAAGLHDGAVLEYLRMYPHAPPKVESFLYWAKETFNGAKPIISITHVSIFRWHGLGRPSTVVAAQQVFATHYLTGSLSLTAVTEPADGEPGYLLYLRQSRADVFGGVFGGMVRRVVERRVRSEAPAVLDGLRRRLESGRPDQMGSRK